MCFSPKIKVPKVNTAAIVPPPTPLDETPAGVQFGGEGKDGNETEAEKARIDLDEEEKEEEKERKKKLDKQSSTLAQNRRSKSINRAFSSGSK